MYNLVVDVFGLIVLMMVQLSLKQMLSLILKRQSQNECFLSLLFFPQHDSHTCFLVFVEVIDLQFIDKVYPITCWCLAALYQLVYCCIVLATQPLVSATAAVYWLCHLLLLLVTWHKDYHGTAQLLHQPLYSLLSELVWLFF